MKFFNLADGALPIFSGEYRHAFIITINASGTTEATAANIPWNSPNPEYLIVRCHRVDGDNTGILLPRGPAAGSVIEIFTDNGSVIAYTYPGFEDIVPAEPFLDGSTSITVTSGARFRSTGGVWAKSD